MADTLALSVILGATASSSFGKVFGGAGKQVGALGKAVKATHIQLNQVQAYQRNDAALDEMRGKLGATQRKVMELRKALKADPDSAKLAKQLGTTQNKAVKLSAALDQQRGKLRQEGEALRKAGIDTRSLNTASERLTTTFNRQKAALAANYAQLEKRKRLGAEFRGQIAKLAGTALAARALAGWTSDAADFDAEMQNIGNTADMTSDEIAALKQSIFEASSQTGRSIGDIQAGIGFLVAAGLDVGRARQSIVSIGRTATAETANIEDLSRASFTLIDSMGIAPKALPRALDILTQSGKEGNVELRDMAQQLPVLGAQFRAFKMQGEDAVATMGAALEIARKGAADPAEAANNMRNFMAKILSPTTLQKAQKNFGLDLYAIIQHAQKTGGNPFEASIQAIMKATGGDAKKMGELFTDMQVQNFLRPMMQNWKEYERIKAKALGAHGVVDRDFAKMEAQNKQGLAEIGQSWDRFKKQVGTAIGGTFIRAFGALKPVLNTLGKLAGEFPHLTGALIGATAAALTFKTAMIGGRWLMTLFMPGVTSVGGAVRALIPGFGLASRAIGIVTGAMRGLSLATLANPIGLVVAGIAAAAFLVYKYWQPIKAFFTGVWQGISEAAGPTLAAIGQALAPLKPLWDGIASAIGTVFGWLGKLFQPFHATQAQLEGATSAGVTFGRALVTAFKVITWPLRTNIKLIMWLGQKIGEFAGWVVTRMGKSADMISGAWNGAIAFVGGLWDGLKAKVGAVVDWIMQKIDWVVGKWNTLKGIGGAVAGKVEGLGARIGNTVGGWWHDATGGGTPALALPGGGAMPAMASRGGYTDSSTHRTVIQVHAAPGMDERALARHVREQLDERDRQQAARRRSTLGDTD